MEQYYKVILIDGSSIWIRGGADVNGTGIFLDVNGKKPPNKIGVDLFAFPARENRIEPEGLNSYASSCINKTNGYTCTAWVVYKGNQEYLRCNDLKWDGKQKCGK